MKVKYFKKSDERERQFFLNLKDKVSISLAHKEVGYGNLSFWAKGLFWTAVSYSSYLLLFSESISKLQFWTLYLIFQLSGLLIGFSLGHDASHNTAFKSKKANSVLHFFSFLTIGIDPLLWGLRHIRSHHLYANVEGSDVDIDKNPFLRLSPTHPWKPKHKYQAFYAPFVYMLTLLHSIFMSDWIYLFSGDYHWMKSGISRCELNLRFALYKIGYFSLVLLFPILFSGFSAQFVIFSFLTASAFTSLIFIVMLVGTHFFEEADYPEPKGEFLEHSWAVHQLYTSCDWNANDGWARFVSGGSNCHAAHHLFPNICHTNYSEINQIIKETTQEYNLPYHHKTLFEMIVSHFRHLNKMGNKIAVLLLVFFMVSCKPSQEANKVKRRDLVAIDRTMSGTFVDTTVSNYGYSIQLSRFFRLQETDSITEINSKNNRLMVTFYDYLGAKHCKTFEGKFRKKYFQFHLEYQTILLPPLLVSLQEDRVRMFKDKNGNLVIHNYTSNEGMVFFFGAGSAGDSQYVFNKK